MGLVLSLLGICAAAGDDPPLAYLGLDQRLSYSDLVCSATIMDTWRTRETLALNDSSVTRENLARADVDSVFKGQLTSTMITFRWYSWPAGDSNMGGGYVYAGPPLAALRSGTRYLLFLRGDDATGWRVTVPRYQLEIPLAPQPAMNEHLRLDASGLAEADRNRLLAEELATAARFLEPQGDTADVYSHFAWIAQLLGKQAIPVVRSFLESANTRLRYFAADRLADLNDGAGRDILLAVLMSQTLDSWMRANAAEDLGKVHATDALPDLEKFAMDDPEPAVRRGALRGIGELGDPRSYGVLVRVLDDPVQENRLLAAGVLEKIVYGKIYALDILAAHEPEIIAAWKAWSAGTRTAPDYNSYIRR